MGASCLVEFCTTPPDPGQRITLNYIACTIQNGVFTRYFPATLNVDHYRIGITCAIGLITIISTSRLSKKKKQLKIFSFILLCNERVVEQFKKTKKKKKQHVDKTKRSSVRTFWILCVMRKNHGSHIDHGFKPHRVNLRGTIFSHRVDVQTHLSARFPPFHRLFRTAVIGVSSPCSVFSSTPATETATVYDSAAVRSTRKPGIPY